MNNKTFWIGFVVVFVLMHAIGFLVHGLWLGETYRSLGAVFRPEEQMNSMMWMMFASSVVYLFLFCYIFTKGYEGRGIGEGLRFGLLIGLFMSVPASVNQYVVYPLPVDLVVKWFVTGVISYMVAGAIFAAIYRPTTPAPAAA